MAGPSQLSPSVTASAVLADIFFLHVHGRNGAQLWLPTKVAAEGKGCRDLMVLHNMQSSKWGQSNHCSLALSQF